MSNEISVPDIGDFESVEIIEILVKPGDVIKKNDPIVFNMHGFFISFSTPLGLLLDQFHSLLAPLGWCRWRGPGGWATECYRKDWIL